MNALDAIQKIDELKKRDQRRRKWIARGAWYVGNVDFYHPDPRLLSQVPKLVVQPESFFIPGKGVLRNL